MASEKILEPDDSLKATTCNILVSHPQFDTTAMWMVIINTQKLIIYFAVYDAIG